MDIPNNDSLIHADSMPPVQDNVNAEEELSRRLEKLQEIRKRLCRSADEVLASKPPRDRSQSVSTYQHRPFDKEAIRERFMGGAASVIQKCREITRQWMIPASGQIATPEAQRSPTPGVVVNGVSSEGLAGASRQETAAETAASHPGLASDEASHRTNGTEPTTAEDALSAENAVDSRVFEASAPSNTGHDGTAEQESIPGDYQPATNSTPTEDGDHLLDDPMDSGQVDDISDVANGDHLLDEPEPVEQMGGDNETTAAADRTDEGGDAGVNLHVDNQPNSEDTRVLSVEHGAGDPTQPRAPDPQAENSPQAGAVVSAGGDNMEESTSTTPCELPELAHSTKRTGSSKTHHRVETEAPLVEEANRDDRNAALPPIADGLVDDDDGDEDELVEEEEDDADMDELEEVEEDGELVDRPNARATRKPLPSQPSTSADSHSVVDSPASCQLSQYEIDLLARHKFKPFKIRLPLVFDAKSLIEKYEAMEKFGRKRHVSSDPIDQLLRETTGLLNRKRRNYDDELHSDSDFDEDDDESTVASTSNRYRKQDAKRVKMNASNGSGRKEKSSSSGGRAQGGGGGTSNRGEKATTSRGKQPQKGTDGGESRNEEGGESDGEIQLSPRKRRRKLDRLLALSTSIRSDESGEEEGGQKVQRKKKNPDASPNNKSRSRKTVYTVSSDSDSDDEEFVDEEEMASDATDDGIDTIVVAGNKKTRCMRSHGQNADKADQRSRKKALQELEDRRRKRKRAELVGGASNKPGKRRRVAVESDEEEKEEEEEADIDNRTNEGEEHDEATGSGRMRFRKMIPKSKLSQSTKDAERAEAERVKRLKQRQLEFNGIELVENARTGECEYTHPATVRHARVKSVVLDDDHDGRPPCPVAVHPLLVRKLMPHQAEGIRFLYNSTFESLSRLNEPGGGAILAHWMGLGKTLQVIAYLHTVLSHPRIAECASRVLVIGPKNVAINWCKEFAMWLGNKPELKTINVVNATILTDLEDRLSAIKGWYEDKGPSVLVLNYELFRVLTEDPDERPAKRGRKAAQQQAEPSKPASKREKKLEKMKPQLRRYLQDPGPDLVICDEGHRLKGEDTALHRCVSKIATSRRICLTGTPLQNKLMEYYTMVNFVKPNLLGNIQEFRNRFSNIIEKGRSKDADRVHVRAMRHRCHVLYRKLEGVVDRKSHGVIASEIPPKNEYVVFIRLTPRQIALYRAYLTEVVNRDSESRRTIQTLYTHFHTFSRICAHPYLLIEHNRMLEARAARREADQSMRAFVVDDDDDDQEGAQATEQDEAGEGSDEIEVLDEDAEIGPSPSNGDGQRRKALTLPKELPQEQRGWFQQLDLVSDTDAEQFSLSNKLIFLAQIIKQCEKVGDKLLVFSQSLESIRLIRRMLHTMADHWFDDGHADLRPENEQWGWQEGEDYLVIDGQTSGKDREEYQNMFNDTSDAAMRMRLLIISTRAGSLGTNLVGANRVVIFDVSWNPTHDTQALFRSYRLGQRKPVYVYRLVAQGTMEERIYARCVTKEATALRVVDEAQIQRIFYARDLDELYRFDPDKPRIEDEDEGEEGGDVDGAQEGPSATATTAATNSQLPKLRLPEDMMLAAVIRSHEKCIVRYDRHDSLFAEQEEEQLDDKERAEAWQDYDDEINNRRNVLFAAEELSANPLHIAQDPRDDPVYPFCWNVKGMTEPMAQLIAVCNRMFDRLLTVIPLEERGEDVDFNSFIIDICSRHGQLGNAETLIDEIYRGKDSTLNTIASFNPTVQQMFKGLNMTMRPIINQLLMQHAQLKQHQKEREG